MKFEETKLPGVYVVRLEPVNDERGFFARYFCKQVFEKKGLHSNFVQANISYTEKKRTLRGLHYQDSPYEEVKLISCVRGKVYDVVVDLRKTSLTYGNWFSIELNETDYTYLYIPQGFAHGYLTLSDNVQFIYLMGNYYQPNAVRGIKWDDPTLNITWPFTPKILSKKDKELPAFSP